MSNASDFPKEFEAGQCAYLGGEPESRNPHPSGSASKAWSNGWHDQRVRTNWVDHPAHYGGADNPYEAIKVIEMWGLNFCLGNAVKYICRWGKKEQLSTLDDLKKARWYLDHEIQRLEK